MMQREIGNAYRKAMTCFRDEAHRIALALGAALTGENPFKNAASLNRYMQPNLQSVKDPYDEVVAILLHAQPKTTAVYVTQEPTRFAWHKNRVWSVDGRNLITGQIVETEIVYYLGITDMAKISDFKPSKAKIVDFAGQPIVIVAATLTPSKFNAANMQAEITFLLADGTEHEAYCTPNTSKQVQSVLASGALPICATVIALPARPGMSSGVGFNDVDDKTELKLMKLAQAWQAAQSEVEQRNDDGTWGKVKKDAKAPTAKAKTTKAAKSK